MKSLIKFTSIFLIIMLITSCKKEATLANFKYANKKLDVVCKQINPELLREAVYAFEEDIIHHFARNGQKSLSQAYSRIINLGIYGRIKYKDMVSNHTKEVFTILKQEKDLWINSGESTTLNYNHELIKCLGDNLKDKNLKTTFNALVSTNSMSAKLFGEPLRRQSRQPLTDKYLATYIALEFYYAKLFNVDFDSVENTNPAKSDPHAGHNH